VRKKAPFHGLFYGLLNFLCKTAQFYATPCEPACLWSPLKNTLRNILKNCAEAVFELKISCSNQLSYAGAAHMKAGSASSSRVRPMVAIAVISSR
jgi:hypothetical protein